MSEGKTYKLAGGEGEGTEGHKTAGALHVLYPSGCFTSGASESAKAVCTVNSAGAVTVRVQCHVVTLPLLCKPSLRVHAQVIIKITRLKSYPLTI